jgi:hypothetical protein
LDSRSDPARERSARKKHRKKRCFVRALVERPAFDPASAAHACSPLRALAARFSPLSTTCLRFRFFRVAQGEMRRTAQKKPRRCRCEQGLRASCPGASTRLERLREGIGIDRIRSSGRAGGSASPDSRRASTSARDAPHGGRRATSAS